MANFALASPERGGGPFDDCRASGDVYLPPLKGEVARRAGGVS